jgi:diguanylate cyclase (GGDEF)-like protein
MDDRRVWFKSSLGFELPQLSREFAFCSHVVATGEMLLIRDARNDARYREHPLVTAPPNVRFYAGVPLSLTDGSVVATLAIFDEHARDLSPGEIEALSDLAAMAEDELRRREGGERRQSPSASPMSRVDALTRLWTREAVLEILKRELSESASGRLAVILADVDRLRDINAMGGPDAGDETLREIARNIRASIRPYDSVGRFGGEEFLVLLPGADDTAALQVAERIRLAVANRTSAHATISVGIASTAMGRKPSEIVSMAERALLKSKEAGGNQARIAAP